MKKTEVVDFTIQVNPRSLGDFGGLYIGSMNHPPDFEKQMRKRCEEIIEEIKRHVDEVHSCWIIEEKQETCSHCGYKWTEKSETYNGGCCDEDEKNNPENISNEKANGV